MARAIQKRFVPTIHAVVGGTRLQPKCNKLNDF